MKHHAIARSRVRWASVGAVVAALSLAACGSSSSVTATGSQSTAGSSSSSQATSSGSSGGSASSGSSSAATAGLAAATANVAKYSQIPTQLTITTPLPAKPAPGKTVVFLQCEVVQCAQGGDGFRAAAAAIGWKTKTLSWETTQPATLVSDMQEALNLSPRPYAVSISGLPQALWQQEVPAYAKAGVLIMPWSIGPLTFSKTIFSEIQDPTTIEEQGKLLADWFIVDSKGKGKVLLQGVPQYPSIHEEAIGFANEVAARCPGCTLTTLNVTGNEVDDNQVTSTIVSALQRDRSIGYVMSSDVALAPGLPEALKTAGLDVKILGGAAIATDLQEVQEGTMAVAMANNQYYNGWQQIDALARHAAGLPVSRNDGGNVQEIITQATVGKVGTADQVPAGYPALFEKLWHVG